VLSAIEALYYCTLGLFRKLQYSGRTVQTMVKKFMEILKRKRERSENENIRSFLARSSVRRLDGEITLNPKNFQGMYHLNNQLFLSKH